MASAGRIHVPFGRPDIDERDIRAVTNVMCSGWIAYGPQIGRFEESLATYVGSRAAVTLNSCTSALEAVLQVSGIGGEVVVPSFTWVAVANAVVNSGAIPRFADVDRATFNLTPESVASAIGPRTEAVIVPHYGGQPADIAGIRSICGNRGILLIEDCAETMGGIRDGRMAGSGGIGCFSFYPTKAITSGMGGAVVSDDVSLVDRIRTWATHGLRSSTPVDGSPHRPWERSAEMPGRNLRMPNMLAALGLEQLARLDELNGRRRAAARIYDELFAGIDDVFVPEIAPRTKHVYQMYSLRLPAHHRDVVLRHLWEVGICANTHFDPPIHAQPCYERSGTAAANLPVTESLRREVLTIPIFPSITDREIAAVFDGVQGGLRG